MAMISICVAHIVGPKEYGPYLGEIQCQNGLSLEKLKNFQNKKEILISFLLFYSL